jgi:TrmH family RNA methyltransferase
MAPRVILLEPEKAGNIGAIARSMKNFDLHDLWIVNAKVAIDGEARAYSMRGLDILTSARIARTLGEATQEVDVIVGTSSVVARSTSNLSRLAITPEQLAVKVWASKGTVGVVFGRESSGLNNQEVEACDFMVTIPASRNYNVLNVATAASIIFYEIFRKRAPMEKFKVASRASRQRLLLHFNRLMKERDIQMHKRRLAQRAFRNVISRSFISVREASLLLGVFRKANSKPT